MKKNVKLFIFSLIPIIAAVTACTPALGSSWYKRNSSDTGPVMYLKELKVAGNAVTPFLTEAPKDEIDKAVKFAEAKIYLVNVPYNCEEVSAENIEASVVQSLSRKNAMQVSVEVLGDGVPLMPGVSVPVIVKIKDKKELFNPLEKIIKVTRKEKIVVQKDLELVALTIHGHNAISGSVTVPYSKTSVSSGDINAKFKFGEDETVIPVELESPSIDLVEDTAVSVKIMVKEKEGQYNAFEKVISITREKKADDEDSALELESIFVLGMNASSGKISIPPINRGITSDDITANFKIFGILNVVLENEPVSFNGGDSVILNISVPAKQGSYLGWNTSVRVIKDGSLQPFNPQDPKGNKKYIVKINKITEEVDPFDYYKEDYDFDGSKFDSWVVNMPDMSGTIASYKFKQGSWSGNPEVCNNDPSSIGSGFKTISDVKCYRYKTRAERWLNHGGYNPNLSTEEAERQKRFYFYRFTAGASLGIKLDNSMFCADKNTKFLFYYSAPSVISGVGVPSEWRDYEQPDEGQHKNFPEPFYMSDPVGYVKQDGSVVMYQWIKNNIENNNYHAQKNASFEKQAEKRASGAGFSPYRNKIKNTKFETIKTENPAYTAVRPEILRQPKAVRIQRGGTENAVFDIKVTPVPEGESLSYQWYKNTNQASENGTAVDGAVKAVFTYPKTEETDCYIYCVVTNTNSSNGKIETAVSDAVKLLITDGSLKTDAETPKITKQPENKIIPVNSNLHVTLEIEAESVDGGNLSYQWYENAEANTGTGTAVEGKTEKTFELAPDSSAPSVKYYYCVVTNTNENVDGNKTAQRVSEIVKVEVEEVYKVNFAVTDGGGSLTALVRGKTIETGSYVKKGEKIVFIAEPFDKSFKVKEWAGVDSKPGLEDKTIAELIVANTEVIVAVSFEKRDMGITIIPKIYNESLKSWSTADGEHFSPKYINGAHFAHDFKMKISEKGSELGSIQWEYKFPIEGSGSGGITGGGHGEYVKEFDFVKLTEFKDDKKNPAPSLVKAFKSFSGMEILLENYLIKSNRHDFWRTEATFGTWPFSPPKVYKKQPLDENSKFKLIYDETLSKWVVAAESAELKAPEHISITYTKDFSVSIGEEKDFEITYTADNHEGTRSKGAVKVIYTVSVYWK